MTGLAANKFIFFSSALQVRTPLSYQRIFGDKSIVDAHGEDHRRIRRALMEFLRPDKLKLYVARITRDRKATMLGQGREQAQASPNTNDLITRLLSLTDPHGEQLLTNEEIVDNLMFSLLAGHDTTSMFLMYITWYVNWPTIRIPSQLWCKSITRLQ